MQGLYFLYPACIFSQARMLAIVCPEHSTRLLRAYNHFAAWLERIVCDLINLFLNKI